MNSKNRNLAVIAVAAAIALVAITMAVNASQTSGADNSITYIPKRVLTLQTGGTILPEAQATETCDDSLDSVKSSVNIPIRTPTVLPEGYALKSVLLAQQDTVYMTFSDDPVCGGEGMRLMDGAIELVEAPLKELTTEKSGAEYIAQQLPKYEAKEMNAQSFEFSNGMKAIGYPAGIGTSRAIDENNVVVHTENYDYAADIWVFDDQTSTVYRITAFLPFEDLIKIAESLK